MAKEYKKLLGNRIYLEMPKKEESKLIVDENTKDALNKELLKKMSKLVVYDVGPGITEPALVPGVTVLVDPKALSSALIIPLSDKKDVLMVGPFDIVHIW